VGEVKAREPGGNPTVRELGRADVRDLAWELPARDLVWLTVIVAVAIVLRLPGLTTGLWRDEGSTYFDATAPSLAGALREIRLAEINPPAFFLLMRGWLALAGTSDLTMRLPAFAFGILILPATYALARQTGLRAGALVAAAFAAVGPAGIVLASDARPYTCAALFAALATLAAFRALGARAGEPIAAPLWGYVASIVVLEYVSYTGLLLAFGLALGALAAAVVASGPRRNAVALAGASGVAALALVPWLLSLRGVERVAPAWLVPMDRGQLVGRIFEQFGFVVPSAFMHVQFSFALLIALVAAVALRRASTAVVAGAVAVVAGLAVEAGALLREPRYAFVFTPLADVLAVVALAALVRACAAFVSGRERNLRAGLAVGLAAALAVSLVQGAHVQFSAWKDAVDGRARSGMRASVAAARPDLGPRTLVVVAPDYLGPSLGYYLRGRAVEGTVGFANASQPEHFRCCAAWRRPALVSDAERAILARARARAVERIAFVYDPGAVDRGSVPYSAALDLRAGLARVFPVLWDRRYPGEFESVGVTLFAIQAIPANPRGAIPRAKS